MRTYTFHVEGMHCHACVLVTESELKEVPGVAQVKSSLKHHTITVAGEFGAESETEIAERLSGFLTPHGYRLHLEKPVSEKKIKWSEFKLALPIALGLALLFWLLQRAGIVNWVGAGQVTYGTAALIGVIASLSSCMAVVGGLLLSLSASFAKGGERAKPQILFHVGRLVAFFILGGVIGALGAAFILNTTATIVLGVLIGLVMLLLGLNLLDILPGLKKFQPAMPQFIARRARGLTQLNHTLTPLAVGAATFFLPCGFTQSMQLYTLSTGHFWQGGLTMLVFALGTLPVLALVSFSSFGFEKRSRAGIFFKTAGLVVIMFALLNLYTSLRILTL